MLLEITTLSRRPNQNHYYGMITPLTNLKSISSIISREKWHEFRGELLDLKEVDPPETGASAKRALEDDNQESAAADDDNSRNEENSNEVDPLTTSTKRAKVDDASDDGCCSI